MYIDIVRTVYSVRSVAKVQVLCKNFKILELNFKFQLLENFQNSGPGTDRTVLKFQNFLVLVRSGPGSTGKDVLIHFYNQLIANLFVGF